MREFRIWLAIAIIIALLVTVIWLWVELWHEKDMLRAIKLATAIIAISCGSRSYQKN